MPPPDKKLLVVDVAALGWNMIQAAPPPSGVAYQRAKGAFPAVTCSVQAAIRTASPARSHGMVSNGLFFKDLRKVLFWEQSASLVEGERIWRRLRERGRKVGMLFWQQSLGEDVDFVLSPRPIHKHEGGMIQDCYSQPHDLYGELAAKLGRPFNLFNYWGPLTSAKSTQWIVDATVAVMASSHLAPDLLFSYLPHLDYDLQRHGPGSKQARKAMEKMHGFLRQLQEACRQYGYDFLFFGDYALGEVGAPALFPNQLLRQAGLFRVRSIKGMAYPDFFTSEAFAVVDHEVAHVHVRDGRHIRKTREVLSALPGVEILDQEAQRDAGVDHGRSGELMLVAAKGGWFAYPWWTDKKEAPDFATHVDIHNKPGYDPCELFFGWPPMSVSMDTTKVRGTHGRLGDDRDIAWTSSLNFDWKPQTLLDLAKSIRDWCERS